MPNIKNSTLVLCEHLDELKIPLRQYNIDTLNNIYRLIIKIYSSINNVKINHLSSESIEGKPNMCLVVQILNYMFQQNLIDTINLSKNDCNHLKSLLIQNKHSDIGVFLNHHSQPIYQVLGNLIWNRKLPLNILQQLDKYDSLIYGHFTPLSVQMDIEKHNLTKNIYQIIYQGKTINLTTFTIKDRKINSKKWDTIIKRLVMMIMLSDMKEINIDLYFIKQEKKLGKNVSLLGPNEINSGVTSWGNVTKVAIFREEELNKLIIHELIHYCELDFHSVNFPYIDRYNINPKNKIILNESYTEIMANIINCICCSYEYQHRENKALFELYLTYEIKYSLYQCAKILSIYGYKNYQEFNKSYDGLNKFKQQTSVFSYFFAKTALLNNLEDFSHFLTKYIKGIQISHSIAAKEVYSNLVHKSLQNITFRDAINSMMKESLKKSGKISPKIKNTLRMTCIES